MTTNRPALTALVLLLAAGCGSGEKLFTLTGTVTYDGKPVPAGVIYFDPDPTKGAGGTQGFATIKDGKFTTGVGGQGIQGGAYDIRVMGFDGKPGDEAPMGKPLWPGEEHTEKRDIPAADTELKIDIPARKK